MSWGAESCSGGNGVPERHEDELAVKGLRGGGTPGAFGAEESWSDVSA